MAGYRPGRRGCDDPAHAVGIECDLSAVGTQDREEPARIELSARAVAALHDHRKRALAEGNAASPWVFCNTLGGPLRRSHFHRQDFKPLLKRAGLPDIRFHDLRHTMATLLLSQGEHPKVVQERLGHSQIGITMDTYSHVLPGMQRAAADRLDAALDAGAASTAKKQKAARA